MSAYQQYINESFVSQHHQDRVREGSTERALRAMRPEQRSDQVDEVTQPVSAVPRPSRLRKAWSLVAAGLASFR